MQRSRAVAGEVGRARPAAGLEAKALVCAAILAVLPGGGCAPQPPAHLPALRDNGEVHVYLEPLPPKAHRLSVRIAAASAVRDDGSPLPLQLALDQLEGKELLKRQRRLASGTLPPGAYRGISLEISKASLYGEDGEADLLPPADVVFVEQAFLVRRRVASALFLSLGPDYLGSEGFSLRPSFSLATPTRQLKGLLGYATNARSNLVTVFNKHTMRVVDTIATSSGPRGLAVDPRRDWVYVALSGDDAIEAIEVNTGVILRRLKLNFGDEPTELALSRDGRLLISANSGSNSASIVDADSLREVARVRLPSEPGSVVAGSTTSRAYLIQPRSNSITEIDLVRANVVATQIFEETPVRGALSNDGSVLFVTTRHSTDLLVLDTESLALRGRIFVGSGATSIRADPRSDLIYVGRRRGGVAVVDPSALTAIDRVPVDGRTAYLDIDSDERSLFVVLPEDGAVQKIDLVNKRLLGSIDIADGGFAVGVLGGR